MSDDEREPNVADNDLDNEEEEIEEYDEDDDDEEARPQKKRRMPSARNILFEEEAEVDEEEDDDEDDDEAEAGFIEEREDEVLGAGVEENDESHRLLDRKLQQRSNRDAEEQAQEYRERYGHYHNPTVSDAALVPKRLLLPSVDDPSIYGIPCAKGKGREVVYSILKKVEERAFTKHPLKIYSALERAGRNRDGPMAEWVYVEARSKADVLEALDGVMFAYPHNKTNAMFLLPIKEMPDLLRVQKSEVLQPGGWVRIKVGTYQGDVAQIIDVDDSGLEVELKIIPREDYGLNEDTNARVQDSLQKRKRAGRSVANRPPPRLFNEAEAKKRHAAYLEPTITPVRGVKRAFRYLNQDYWDGYLIKTYKLQQVDTRDIKPSLEEVQLFAGDGEEESLDLSALAQSIKNSTSGEDYIAGDTVEIWEGEQKGVWGKVVSVRGDIATMTVSDGALRGQRIEVPVKGLRKRFREGDLVKVIGNGRFRDETGLITNIKGDQVTIWSESSNQEITVFSKDLRVATDSGPASVGGKYSLHDLVALDPATVGVVVKVERELLKVLDQYDTVRTLTPSQISQKIERRKNAVATDRNGSEIRTDDTVKEVEGERRSGVIMHIHRSFLFLHNREQQENSGIIATRSQKVATVAAKGGRMAGATDLSRMNPALLQQGKGSANGHGPGMMPPPRPMGRDPVIGKTIVICKGTYKGLLGIVKDANDDTARVELHTKNKTLPIPKDHLRIKDAQGNSVSYAEFASRGRGRMGMNRKPESSHPVNMMGGGGGGGGGGWGGRTPWGGATAYGGGRQPDGGRTPWGGEGGRTAYGGGGGGGDGGRTPAYGGGDGGKTPGWNMDGGKTPAYGTTADDDDDNFPKYS